MQRHERHDADIEMQRDPGSSPEQSEPSISWFKLELRFQPLAINEAPLPDWVRHHVHEYAAQRHQQSDDLDDEEDLEGGGHCVEKLSRGSIEAGTTPLTSDTSLSIKLNPRCCLRASRKVGLLTVNSEVNPETTRDILVGLTVNMRHFSHVRGKASTSF